MKIKIMVSRELKIQTHGQNIILQWLSHYFV